MGLLGGPKITLMLEKYNFNPGEVVKGTVKLNLKKPMYARKLEVSLMGVRKVRKGNSWQWQKVYDFDMPISGEIGISTIDEVLSLQMKKEEITEGEQNIDGFIKTVMSK